MNQFALVSTVMPHASRQTADTYRWAIIVSAVLVFGATALGLLPVAIAGAAFLIPIAYLVYMYDVNLWEDAPVSVVASLFLVTGLLSIVVTWFFFEWAFAEEFGSLLAANRVGIEGLPVAPLLIFAVLLPIVAEFVKNAPAILLARRPQFDDMIDALTFGIAAGTAYAAFETIVLFRPVITSADFQTTDGLATWFVIVANLMVVKTLIYGTATGIAVAAFSGKGVGHDGFTRKYAANFGLAIGANVAYWLGIRLLAHAPFGQALGLLWGMLILAALVIRVRVILQSALLEAALEDSTTSATTGRATSVETFCPECANTIRTGSQFCVACGTSVRATSRQARQQMTASAPEGAAASQPATEHPFFALSGYRTVVLTVAGLVLIGGLGALAAAASGNQGPPSPTSSDSGESELFDSASAPDPGRSGSASSNDTASGRRAPLLPEATSADSFTIGGDLKISIPAGWSRLNSNENALYLGNGKGTTLYFDVDKDTKQATQASQLFDSVRQYLHPPSLYTKVTTYQLSQVDVVGTLISRAQFQYDATRTDLQGSRHVYGVVWIAIRQDKTVLLTNAEHSPAEDWDKKIEVWLDTAWNATLRFAGIGPT